MKNKQITAMITPRNSRSLNVFLEEIKDFGLLSHEEEVNIFEEYSKTKDPVLLERIAQKNVRFVVSIAKQYMHYKNTALEDLISVGSIGLIKSAERFDSTRGFRFISYAVFYIRSEIITYIENNINTIRIPRNVNASYVSAERKLLKGQELTKYEESAIAYKLSARVSSLDDKIGDDDSTLIDTIENKDSTSPLLGLFNGDKSKFVIEVINTLNPKESDIVKSLFGLDGHEIKEIKEIAGEYGVSSARISEIRSCAYFKLKRRFKSKTFINSYKSIIE
jgi:RNA polymerase primary sigma factor